MSRDSIRSLLSRATKSGRSGLWGFQRGSINDQFPVAVLNVIQNDAAVRAAIAAIPANPFSPTYQLGPNLATTVDFTVPNNSTATVDVPSLGGTFGCPAAWKSAQIVMWGFLWVGGTNGVFAGLKLFANEDLSGYFQQPTNPIYFNPTGTGPTGSPTMAFPFFYNSAVFVRPATKAIKFAVANSAIQGAVLTVTANSTIWGMTMRVS